MTSFAGTFAFFATNAVAGLAIARVLGPSLRGEVTYAFLLMSVGSTVASIGLDHAATLVLAAQRVPSRTDLRRIAGLAMVSGTAVAALVTLGAALLRRPLATPAVLLGVLTYTVSQVGAPAAIAAGLVRQVAAVRVVTGTGYLAATLVALHAAAWPGWLVWCWAAAGAVLGTAFVGLAWRRTAGASTEGQSYAALLRVGRPGWHSSLAQIVTYRLDQVVVLLLSGATALGQYSVAVFGMSSLWLLSDSVGELEYPEGTRLDPDSRRRRAVRVALRLAGLVAVLGGLEVAMAAVLVRPVLGEGFDRVPILLALLLPGTVANATAKVLSAALYAGGHGLLVRRAVFRTAAGVAVLTWPAVLAGGAVGAAALSSIVFVALTLQVYAALRGTAELEP